MPQVTIRKISIENGKAYIRFANGHEYEFHSAEEARTAIRDLDEETLEKIAIALILKRRPTLINVAAIEGKSVVVDLDLNNWGTVV